VPSHQPRQAQSNLSFWTPVEQFPIAAFAAPTSQTTYFQPGAAINCPLRNRPPVGGRTYDRVVARARLAAHLGRDVPQGAADAIRISCATSRS
jgi:hypothetical protein